MSASSVEKSSKPVALIKPMIASESRKSAEPPSRSPKPPSEELKHLSSGPRPVLTATKAKFCKFFKNGDRFFKGVCVAVSSERYRSLDSVAEEVTRAMLMIGGVVLPSGVRVLYDITNGKKINSADELKDGGHYACGGPGEAFKKSPYVLVPESYTHLKQQPRTRTTNKPSIRPQPVLTPSPSKNSFSKLAVFIRHGTRPRRVVRVLLNKRNSPSFEVALTHITECVKLDGGAVRKIYTLEGKQVLNLTDLFENDSVFVAYSTERHSREDFFLDPPEHSNLLALQRRSSPMTNSATSKITRKSYGSAEFLNRPGRQTSYKLPKPSPLTKPKMPNKTKKPLPATKRQEVPPNDDTDVFELPAQISTLYDVGHIIGDGNFAVVRECRNRETNQMFAMKIIEKSKCRGKEHMIDSEVAILRRVKHPNIVYLQAEYDYPEQLFLIMELVKGGDLFDNIAAESKFAEREAAVLTRHLVSALQYLHQRRIVHRDIKPENLLVDIDECGHRVLKLGDFGLAEEVTKPLTIVCGTPTYVAPEILAETGYGLKVDIWAAGVILYIMLCGFPPFVSHNNVQEELFDMILCGNFDFPFPYWLEVSDLAKDLICSMLQVDQELRFSADDVLDHTWLTECFSDDEASLLLYHKLGVHFEHEKAEPMISMSCTNVPSSMISNVASL